MRVAQSFDFRMGLAGPAMPALTYDSAAAHKNGSDRRIWRCVPKTATGQAESQPHEINVRRRKVHFGINSATIFRNWAGS